MKRSIMIGLALLGGAIGGVAGEYAAGTNPALFYWQAFALLPQVDASEYSRAADYYDRAAGDTTAPRDESSDKLLASLDNTFRLIHKGFESKKECNWGIDMSDGPYACLPHLAKAKWISQLGVNVRGRYFLQKGKSDAAVAETLAVLKLGRDTARDRTLVSMLVQGAIENGNLKFIADHFGMFGDADIQRLADGIKTLPPHLTVKDTIPVERTMALDWYMARVKSIIAHPSDKGALADCRAVLVETIDRVPESGQRIGGADVSDQILHEAGGTPEGLLAYLNTLAKWYDEADLILAMPNRDIVGNLDQFSAKVDKEGSTLAREFLPALGKAQRKDLWTQTHLAILDAAIAYRLHGKAGFDAIREPVVEGSFQLVTTGTGFEIRSKLNSEFGPDKNKGKPISVAFTVKK